jgi:hypothetical protein
MLECDVWDRSLVTILKTLGARRSLVLTRERRVVGVARRVWPSGRMTVTRGRWRCQTNWKIGELDAQLKRENEMERGYAV